LRRQLHDGKARAFAADHRGRVAGSDHVLHSPDRARAEFTRLAVPGLHHHQPPRQAKGDLPARRGVLRPAPAGGQDEVEQSGGGLDVRDWHDAGGRCTGACGQGHDGVRELRDTLGTLDQVKDRHYIGVGSGHCPNLHAGVATRYLARAPKPMLPSALRNGAMSLRSS